MKSFLILPLLLISSLQAEPDRIQIALASIQMAKDYIWDAQENSDNYQIVEDSCFRASIFLRNAEVALEDLQGYP